jgi:[acyl-carrier-protein] S-malonyltransferase
MMTTFDANAGDTATARALPDSAPSSREALATRALVFPGQGSQAVGMGRALAQKFSVAREVFAEVDAALGESLSRLMAEGPEDTLTLTENAQPALMAVSMAVLRVLEQEHGLDIRVLGRFVAGHSLGEYTALVAADALSYGAGLALVAARGRAMAAAADQEPSGMAALIGGDDAAAEALAATRRSLGGRLWVANLNAPGQVVVAGGAEDIAWAVEAASEHGVRRVVALNVAGAFHSPFMEPAAAALAEAMGEVIFGAPTFPVWANATAAPHGDSIGRTLLTQLTAPVRFRESLNAMASVGVDTFVHVGPGDVTAGLVRKSVEGATTLVISSLDDVTGVAAALAS